MSVVEHRAERLDDRHPGANLVQIHEVLVKPIAVQAFGGGEPDADLGRVCVKRPINAIHQLVRDATLAVVPTPRIGEHPEVPRHGVPELLARLRAQLPPNFRIGPRQNRLCRRKQIVAGAEVRLNGRLGRVVGDRFGAAITSPPDARRDTQRITAPARFALIGRRR